ncbi:MAG: hypothetical protein JRF33_17600 [Deltaproteobacteria bacterium]|nr:hypothetical protein [Deltaproteobacteria bacterium]
MDSSTVKNKRTQDLKQASLRLCLGSGLFWWLFLWSGASVGFRWLAVGGQVDKQYTFWMTLWGGFFTGFVATLSTRLQIRRKLLIGKLEPSLNEWKWLQEGKPKNLNNSIWPAVLLSGVLLAVLSGAIQLAISRLGEGSTYFRSQHIFYAGWLPALFLPFFPF